MPFLHLHSGQISSRSKTSVPARGLLCDKITKGMTRRATRCPVAQRVGSACGPHAGSKSTKQRQSRNPSANRFQYHGPCVITESDPRWDLLDLAYIEQRITAHLCGASVSEPQRLNITPCCAAQSMRLTCDQSRASGVHAFQKGGSGSLLSGSGTKWRHLRLR